MAETPFSVIAIVRQGGLLLSVSRKHNHQDLGFPGGKVEPGEAPEDAVVRELLEETSIRASTAPRKVYMGESTNAAHFTWAYEIDSWEGTPRSMEGTWVGWISPTRFVDPRNSFFPYYHRMFEALGIHYE